jgi:hypothetical protein
MRATACTEHDTTQPTDATTMEQPSDYLRSLNPPRRHCACADPEAHLNDAGSSDDGDEFRLPPAWAKVHAPRPRPDEWDPDTVRRLATSVDPDTAAFERRHGILILGAADLLIMMAEPVMRGSDTWDLALAQYRALQEL